MAARFAPYVGIGLTAALMVTAVHAPTVAGVTAVAIIVGYWPALIVAVRRGWV